VNYLFKKIPLGCKSPLLKHIVSFHRQVYMILRSDIDELNISFKFKVDCFDCVIFATMESFGCGKEGFWYELVQTKMCQSHNEGQSVDKRK